MTGRRRRGAVELAVARLLADLVEDTVPGQKVYASMSLVLARTLDEGAGLAVAAVNRELRETVKVLTGGEVSDGDPRTADLLARLSAPLGHSAN